MHGLTTPLSGRTTIPPPKQNRGLFCHEMFCVVKPSLSPRTPAQSSCGLESRYLLAQDGVSTFSLHISFLLCDGFHAGTNIQCKREMCDVGRHRTFTKWPHLMTKHNQFMWKVIFLRSLLMPKRLSSHSERQFHFLCCLHFQ